MGNNSKIPAWISAINNGIGNNGVYNEGQITEDGGEASEDLGLIQVSSGNSDAHIVQFDRKHYKAPNLVSLLEDHKITKIFHYGRADIAHIK